MGGAGDPPVGADPFAAGRRWIAAVLIGCSLLAWAGTVRWGMQMGSMPLRARPMGAALFLVMWGVMQAAMMFPSVVFMATAYAAISRRRAGPHRLRTGGFLLGYLGIWILTGALAYPLWVVLHGAVGGSAEAARGIGAAIFVVAGLYQLTPLKYRCLSHCRSPVSFFIRHPVGRSPADGLRLGLHHGAYCVACCWALMIVLFAVGWMNLAWMGLLTLAIFLEKTHRLGQRIGRLNGIVLIGLGLLLLGGPPVVGRFLIGS